MRWPGMMQKNTLALMLVAKVAPMRTNAARPAYSWLNNQHSTATNTNNTNTNQRSPWARWPKVLHKVSYTSQKPSIKTNAVQPAA